MLKINHQTSSNISFNQWNRVHRTHVLAIISILLWLWLFNRLGLTQIAIQILLFAVWSVYVHIYLLWPMGMATRKHSKLSNSEKLLDLLERWNGICNVSCSVQVNNSNANEFNQQQNVFIKLKKNPPSNLISYHFLEKYIWANIQIGFNSSNFRKNRLTESNIFLAHLHTPTHWHRLPESMFLLKFIYL